MNAQRLAVIVQRGHQGAYDTLLQEFGHKGVRVIWDRRFEERRRQSFPVAADRRARQRRQDAESWNVLHFRVIALKELLPRG